MSFNVLKHVQICLRQKLSANLLVQLLRLCRKVQLRQSRSAASASRSAAFRASSKVVVVFIRKL
jgi:hypothetical protein